MNTFDINNILEYYQVQNLNELSKVLFPNVKYPRQAFDRVLKGETYLDSAQIELLASYLGVLASDLFTLKDWKGGWNNTDKCLSIIKGEYQINLNYNGAFMTVYKSGKQVHQIVSGGIYNMQLPDFIQYINNLIKKF